MPLPTIATIAQLATATGHAVNLIKAVGEKIKNGKKITVEDILEIQVTMMDMQGKQQSIISDNAELQARAGELEEAMRFKGELVRDGNALFLKTDEKHAEPYCIACWGYERKLVGMRCWPDDHGYECVACDICEARKGVTKPSKS